MTTMPKPYNASIEVSVSPELAKLIEDSQKCFVHKTFYAAFSMFGAKKNELYRLYRRGKNRCLRCGVKLNGL